MSANMIKSVVFDLDGTLYDEGGCYTAAMEAAAAVAAERYGIAADEFRSEAKVQFAWQEERFPDQAALHDRHMRFQRILEAHGKPPSGAWQIAQSYWEAYLETMRVRPDAADTLAALRARGVRVGVGTNMTCAMQLSKIERLGLGRFVDFVVSSEEAGCEKPNPRFFSLVCEKARCAAGEVLFCGDNLALDARGAKSAGMRGVWLVTASGQSPADAPDVESVLSLSGIVSLLSGGSQQ